MTIRKTTKHVTIPRALQGRYFKAADAAAVGISRPKLYQLFRNGYVVRVGRGLFAPTRLDLKGQETLAEATAHVPQGVICLLSALSFHGLTTQLPHQVWMAIPEKAWKPVTTSLPLHIVRFSGPAYTEGIEEHQVGQARVRVYNPAKTVADCFKYRNKIGLDVALEALRDYWRQRKGTMDELLQYAEICRVARVIRPYIEALVQ